jgi:lysophospholipase L1-like esterase
MRDRLRGWLLGLAALILGSVLALGLGELGVRLLFAEAMPPMPDGHANLPGIMSVDPHYGVYFTPGWEGVLPHPTRPVSLRVNRLGLRGPEHPPTVEGSRWLLLGDSYVMGLQVPEDRTVSARLSERLDLPVINAGVSGHDSWDELALHGLLSQELQLEGTILVLYTGNDLLDNLRNRRSPHPEPPPLQPRVVTPPLRWALLTWLQRRSMLVLVAHTLVFDRIVDEVTGDVDGELRDSLRFFTAAGEPELQVAASASIDAVRMLRERCRGSGQELLVALAPPPWAVDPALLERSLRSVGLDDAQLAVEAPHRALLARLDHEGIPACDLTPALLAAQRAGRAPFLRLEGHWSPAGHEVAADALARCLADRGP